MGQQLLPRQTAHPSTRLGSSCWICSRLSPSVQQHWAQLPQTGTQKCANKYTLALPAMQPLASLLAVSQTLCPTAPISVPHPSQAFKAPPAAFTWHPHSPLITTSSDTRHSHSPQSYPHLSDPGTQWQISLLALFIPSFQAPVFMSHLQSLLLPKLLPSSSSFFQNCVYSQSCRILFHPLPSLLTNPHTSALLLGMP